MKPSNKDLILAFGQGQVKLPPPIGSAGNCASIALIKAAIEIFGVGFVFTHRVIDYEYVVTYKNGVSVKFDQVELDRSIYVADLVLNTSDPAKLGLYKSIYDYANIALCAMAKRVMEIGEVGQGIGDFEKALRALHDGANTPSLPEKLGLEEYCRGPVNLLDADGKGLFGWLRAHTVYISGGLRDNYGEVATNTWRYPRRMQISESKIA